MDFDEASAAWMANKIRRGCQVAYRCSVDGCKRVSSQRIQNPSAPHRCTRHFKWSSPTQPAAMCSPVATNPPSVLTEHAFVPPEEIPVLHVIDVSTTTQTEAPPVLRRSRRLKQLSAISCHELPARRRRDLHCVAEADDRDLPLHLYTSDDSEMHLY